MPETQRVGAFGHTTSILRQALATFPELRFLLGSLPTDLRKGWYMADSPIRVVLADDDVLARPLLSELLASMGYAVVGEAGTGREAIAVAAEVVPDVVLLDVHMPDGSGIDAAKAITATGAPTAVVLFSGDQTVIISADDARATAAIAFLPKPAPPGILDSTPPSGSRSSRSGN
jgi:CheY-like chemotaxis protein